MHFFIVAWGIFFAPPVQFNPFVNFKPVPPPIVYYGPPRAHWKATECAVTDQACLKEHDSRVMTMGIMTGNVQLCWEALAPARCADAVRLILGEPLGSARTLLVDPWIDSFADPKPVKRKTP
jgi:hypothetical protein